MCLTPSKHVTGKHPKKAQQTKEGDREVDHGVKMPAAGWGSLAWCTLSYVISARLLPIVPNLKPN